MTGPQKNTLLASAVLAGLISLPMTWMTFSNASISSPVLNMPNGAEISFNMPSLQLNANGLNGSVRLLFQTPFWFVMATAILAALLQLARSTELFEVPKWAAWVAAGLATAWISVTWLTGLFSSKASVGIGLLPATYAAVVPLVTLFLKPESPPTPPADAEPPPPMAA